MSKQHVSIRLTDFHGGFLSFSWPSISLSEAGEESRRSIDVFSFDSEDSVVGDCIGIINVDPGILQEPTWLDAIHTRWPTWILTFELVSSIHCSKT